MEVDAPGGDGGRERGGEEVGDARLAGADGAVDVETAEGLAGRRVGEGGLQGSEARDERCLAGVGGEALTGEKCSVGGYEGGRGHS